jgi:hypoxanthine phosphoribosyltransferase
VENVKADYVGFTIPDQFVVGYGMDFAERYRNLPFVGVLHPSIYLFSNPAKTVIPKQKRKRKIK